ncbi:MBL fold metallo-hydrolase [Candidatus Sumerlaeota bacterium]|nr:MBL fold metallo-hydrolase [Candidatus Sumerlaeota bacterium]
MIPNRSPLSFLVLGIGDFFSKLYYHTHFIIYADENPVLVDCPDPLPKALYEASQKSGIEISLDDIDHVILTHLHGDHSNGLESLGFYNYFVLKRKPVIHTIPEVKEAMWVNKLKASMSPITNDKFEKTGEFQLGDFFRLKMLPPGKTSTIKGMKIRIRYTRHYIPCFGFKVHYKGRCLGYSSDTVFDPEHIGFLSDCDLILHETNHGGHTKYEMLESLPPSIRKKIRLIHIYDEFDVKKTCMPVVEQGKLYHV